MLLNPEVPKVFPPSSHLEELFFTRLLCYAHNFLIIERAPGKNRATLSLSESEVTVFSVGPSPPFFKACGYKLHYI